MSLLQVKIISEIRARLLMESGNYFLLMMLPIPVIYLEHVDKEMSLGCEEYSVLVMQNEESIMSVDGVPSNPAILNWIQK